MVLSVSVESAMDRQVRDGVQCGKFAVLSSIFKRVHVSSKGARN